MITNNPIDSGINFLFEKRTKVYSMYTEESIAKEKLLPGQEALQNSIGITRLAGKVGGCL